MARSSTVARRRAGSPRRSAGRGSSLTVFYIVLITIAVIGGGALLWQARAGGRADVTRPLSEVVLPITAPTGQTPDGFWYKGAPDAPVTVVVYSDFQCPACAAAFQQIEGAIDQKYVNAGTVQMIYHDVLLPQHHNAQAAALAARAAGEQGRFWAMHDALFARQTQWAEASDPTELFVGYAAELGLDTTAFRKSLTDQQAVAAVQQASQAAFQTGIQATPTFVVDGSPVSAPNLQAAIDSALRAKGR